MRAPAGLLVASVVLLAGCLSGAEPVATSVAPEADLSGAAALRARSAEAFRTDGEWSYPLVAGLLAIKPVESVFVDVELPATEGVGAAAGAATVHLGLWLPDVPEGTTVPVIADVGPYYADGDVAATEPANRLGRFLIENFVPHGYAVAQVSVFGSGESTHCMDLMGASEQAGVDAAVTWLGTQPWSNGNVGLIGRSYDGSTPWEAATFGNPHLRTIVPISGLIGMHELMWRNGSAEFRAPIMHNYVYGDFGIDSVKFDGADSKVSPDPADAHTLCKDYVLGPAEGAGAYVTGDHVAPQVNDYWSERYFLDRALANYKGSVYFVHGLQDWNVDPHMAFPAYGMLQEAGIEVKGLFGQWAHMYPDRLAEHERLESGYGKEAVPASVRYDWAQDLLEWFDYYLKGTGPKPSMHAEVQDHRGAWRVEGTYPPADATWVEIPLSAATKLHDGPEFVGGPKFFSTGAWRALGYEIGPLDETKDVRIAGTPQLHVRVTPTGPGGQLFAVLYDADEELRLGHAIMDLRFADGGKEMQPVVPGQPIVAKMEFEAFDVVVPAGHRLHLYLAPTGMDYLPSAVSDPVLVDASDASLLRLSTVERDESVFFTPP